MTPNPPTKRPANAVLIGLGGTLAGAALLAAGGVWPAQALAGEAGRIAMIVAVLVALLGGWAGMLPAVLSLGGPPLRFLNGFFLGLGARFAITLLGAFVALRLMPELAYFTFMLCVATAQAVVLAVDTAVLLLLCKPSTRVAE